MSKQSHKSSSLVSKKKKSKPDAGGSDEKRKQKNDSTLELGVAATSSSDQYIELEKFRKKDTDEDSESASEDTSSHDGDDESVDAPEKASKMENKQTGKSSKLSMKQGVIYLGHIPHGFYEAQMRSFFEQFGTVVKLRLSRSPRTGRSRGYAFIQFENDDVAAVVQKAMHNYILCDKLLVCDVVKPDNVHERMFEGSEKRRFYRRTKRFLRESEKVNRERTLEEKLERNKRVKRRRTKQAKLLREKGIDYEFQGGNSGP